MDLAAAGSHGKPIAVSPGVEQQLSAMPTPTVDGRLDRILCAVTFSPSAQRVVGWAAAMAAASEGEVRLFHALPPAGERPFTPADTDPERALRKLLALAQQLPGRPRISAAVGEGDAAAEILRQARLVKADLIALGMHAGDGSVSPLAARLAIDAPCPVLVVDERRPAPIEQAAVDDILVAVNFLPASLAAADYAFALARRVGARVTVVHVLPEHWEGPGRRDADVDETRRLVEHHFRQLLQIAVTASGAGRDRSELVTSGRPCVEIVRIANSQKADLIVMGIDAGRRSQEEFGETTSCVMQFACRTVLLVPERLFRAPRGRRAVRSHRLH